MQPAINQAAQDRGEVWVAAGTYAGPITLPNGVKLFGGFAGFETSVSATRPHLYKTYLSGGSPVVRTTDTDAMTLLRGFYITGGTAPLDSALAGAGIRLTNSSAGIVDCVLTLNNAAFAGGGAATYGQISPTFVNCRFFDNDGGLGGGAVAIHEGSPTFMNSLFYRNFAWEGGAVANFYGSAAFIHCTFSNNQAVEGSGGALYDTYGAIVVRNSILWSNSAARANSDQIFNGSDRKTTVTYSTIQMEDTTPWPGVGNSLDDPRFVSVSNDDYRLFSDSPCVDAADDTAIPVDTYDLDWDGNTDENVPSLNALDRPFGNRSDMGAYELRCTDLEPPQPDPDMPNNGMGVANRYISFVPREIGRRTAIRVTLTILPGPFQSFEGTRMWVGTPQDTSERAASNDATPPTFKAAALSCEPVYLDWGSLGTIYVYDDEIVPGATYQIQAIYDTCDTATEDFYSAALTVATSHLWGDITGDCSVSPCTPPDGIVDMVDVNAVEDKRVDRAGAIIKARADVDPDVPDRFVTIQDTLRVIDASEGLSYPFDGPAECQEGGDPPPDGGGGPIEGG